MQESKTPTRSHMRTRYCWTMAATHGKQRCCERQVAMVGMWEQATNDAYDRMGTMVMVSADGPEKELQFSLSTLPLRHS